MNIAELGIRIDSTDTARATTELEKLVQAGGKAEQSTSSLLTEIGALEKSLAAGAKSTAELGKQREQLARLTKLGAYNEAEFDKVTKQLDKSQIALVKSSMDEQKALSSLLGAIDPARAAMAKMDKQVEDLGKHLDAGRISQEQYNAALAKLDGKSAGVEKTAAGFNKLSLSSRQSQENVMQVINGLSSGDWGNAVRGVTQLGVSSGASAASLLALAAPVALVTAGVGGLAAAYLAGSKEQEHYNQSLVLTGNFAGTSAAQLGDMAREVSATVGTTGAAAEVLATLAGNGKLAGDSFDEIAVAALAMQQATGKAVQDTIGEFVKLADEPVKASAALNDQYHYLTASVYAQIAALEEQGDHVGAVKLATDTYADTVKTRAGEITQNLGLIERGWLAIKNAALGALDAAKSVGREASTSDLIGQTQSQLDFLSQNPSLGVSVPGERGTVTGKEGLQVLKGRLVFLNDQKAAEEEIARLEGDQAKANQLSITAQSTLNSQLAASASNAEKLKARLAEIDKLAAGAAGGEGGRVYTDAELEKLRAAARNQYKDPKSSSASTTVDLSGFNAAKNSLAEIVSTYKNAGKELEATQRAGLISQQSYLEQRTSLLEQEKAEVANAYQSEIAALEATRDKAGTTAAQRIQIDQKIADARTDMVKAQQAVESELATLAINEEGRLRKQALAVNTYTDALQQQVDTLRQQGLRAAAGVGQGGRQRELTDKQNSIDDGINQKKLDLANQYGDGSRGMSLDEYNDKLKALQNTQNDLHATVISNYDDMSTAQASWVNGAERAFADYAEQAENIAGHTANLIGGVLEELTQGAGDSFAEAIVNGDDLNESMRNLGNSILTNVLSALVQMGTRYAINSALEIAGITAVTGAKTAAAATEATAKIGAITATKTAASIATAASTTEQVAAAGTTASSWLPASIAASIGSFGTAAAVGLAAVIAAMAFSGGFRKGGYTGNGGVGDVAGVVHGKEFVMNAEATSRIGVGTLEAMQRGDTVSIPTPAAGSRSASNSASGAAPGRGGPAVVNVTFNQKAENTKDVRRANASAARDIGRIVSSSGRYS